MNLRHNLVIPTAYLTIGMCGVYPGMYQISSLQISQSFQINTLMMGVLIGVFYAGVCIPPLLLGSLSEKLGKRGVLIISLPLMILGTFFVSIAGNIALFLISVFIIGAGFSVTEATMSAVLSAEFPGRSKLHLGMSQAFFSLGAVGAPFASEALFAAGQTYKDLFLYVSILFAVMLVLFLFSRQQKDTKGSSHAGFKAAVSLFSNKSFFFFAVAMFLCVGIEEIVAFFTDSYFELTLRSPEFSALALGLFWVCMIPPRLLLGTFKQPHKTIVLICAAGTAACSVAIILFPDITTKLIMFGLLGFFCGPTWPLIMDLTAKRYPKNVGLSINVMMSVSGFGGLLTPIFVGALIVGANFVPVFIVAAACAGGIAIAFIIASRKPHNKTLENGS